MREIGCGGDERDRLREGDIGCGRDAGDDAGGRGIRCGKERDSFAVRLREMCRGRTTERDRLDGERWFYGKMERDVSREDH